LAVVARTTGWSHDIENINIVTGANREAFSLIGIPQKVSDIRLHP
jgi:hypothetical protein